MPFKGDMRLGGRHSNVASLNGTASDFNGVPAYGTFLHGPEDTSRNESDYNGGSFYMPYETNWYANGLGGEYSTETWGLQYLPEGWVTNSVDNPNYDEVLTVYPLGGPPCVFQIVQGVTDYIEDGTGINYAADGGRGVASSGDYICQDVTLSPYEGFELVNIVGSMVPPYESFYRYIFDGGNYAEPVFADDAKDYYPNGANTGVTEPETFSVVVESGDEPTPFPTGRTVNYRWDGNGGFYGVTTGNYTAAGTVFLDSGHDETSNCNGGLNSYYPTGRENVVYYHSNGTGGYYTTEDTTGNYFSYGTLIYSDEDGEGNIVNYRWDGNGGFYQN